MVLLFNMSKLQLSNVTLLGIDCVNVERLKLAMDISERNIKFGAVKLLTSLHTNDARAVKIPKINSIEEFSAFCIKELNNYVDTKYVLLAQYDGFILNPESWSSDFLKYDYVGAPLSWKNWRIESLEPFTVGNGGFCLRSKRFLEASSRFSNEGKITKFHPEDAALCLWYRDLFEKEGMTFAPVDLAMKFSVVEDYGVYDKPFGFHGLFNKNMDSVINNYPDFPINIFLPRMISKRIEKVKKFFKENAIEGFIFGSIVSGSSDLYSDIKIWISFKNEEIKNILEKRSEYFSQIGDVVNVSEISEDKPVNGVHSLVTYKSKVGEFHINYYFCPQSTPFAVVESKKLF